MKKLQYSDLSISIDIPYIDWKNIQESIHSADFLFNYSGFISILKSPILFEKQLNYYNKYPDHSIKNHLLNSTLPMYIKGRKIYLGQDMGYHRYKEYTYDIYNFFHQAPIFILLFHHTIPYSLKEIWEDFQESGNYHRKPRIDPEFRSNCCGPDIILRYQ